MAEGRLGCEGNGRKKRKTGGGGDGGGGGCGGDNLPRKEIKVCENKEKFFIESL